MNDDHNDLRRRTRVRDALAGYTADTSVVRDLAAALRAEVARADQADAAVEDAVLAIQAERAERQRAERHRPALPPGEGPVLLPWEEKVRRIARILHEHGTQSDVADRVAERILVAIGDANS